MTTTANERKEQDKLRVEFRRTLLHLKVASHSTANLMEMRTLKEANQLRHFAKEVLSKLGGAVNKVEWFLSVALKVAPQLQNDLQLTSANFCNIANLNDWVIETPGDIDDEVDFIVSSSRRREIMHRSWRAAIGQELTEQDEQRFNAWYNANFHGDKTLICSLQNQQRDSSNT